MLTRVLPPQARFFHMIFREEFGRVAGHFGPINTLAFAPDGRSYVSGGEDGYVRMHFFDDDYFARARKEEVEFEAMERLAREDGEGDAGEGEDGGDDEEGDDDREAE